MSQFCPMLAATVDNVGDLKYPLLASPKLDGIRVLCTAEGPVTRKLKPLPNKKLFDLFNEPELIGFDGEIIVGSPQNMNTFQTTTSQVMSQDKDVGNARLYVFDDFRHPQDRFIDRLAQVYARLSVLKMFPVQALMHKRLYAPGELLQYEDEMVNAGFEGVIIRHPDGPYKYGRSTLNEGWLVKFKRFVDDEAEIIGYEPLMHNANEAKKNALGRTERSSAKAGKMPMETMGSLVVKCVNFPKTFNVGSGWSSKQGDQMWADRASLIGKVIRFKYQQIGIVEKPRFPVFQGFRED